MELLATRGPEQIDCWSVSLGQDAIGTQETVKETRLELKRRFALAANVLDEETAQLKQQATGISLFHALCSVKRHRAAQKHTTKVS